MRYDPTLSLSSDLIVLAGALSRMFSRGLAGERLVNSPDPEVRQLYSYMSDTQKEWAAKGFDTDFVSVGAIGSARPLLTPRHGCGVAASRLSPPFTHHRTPSQQGARQEACTRTPVRTSSSRTSGTWWCFRCR